MKYLKRSHRLSQPIHLFIRTRPYGYLTSLQHLHRILLGIYLLQKTLQVKVSTSYRQQTQITPLPPRSLYNGALSTPHVDQLIIIFRHWYPQYLPEILICLLIPLRIQIFLLFTLPVRVTLAKHPWFHRTSHPTPVPIISPLITRAVLRFQFCPRHFPLRPSRTPVHHLSMKKFQPRIHHILNTQPLISHYIPVPIQH